MNQVNQSEIDKLRKKSRKIFREIGFLEFELQKLNLELRQGKKVVERYRRKISTKSSKSS